MKVYLLLGLDKCCDSADIYAREVYESLGDAQKAMKELSSKALEENPEYFDLVERDNLFSLTINDDMYIDITISELELIEDKKAKSARVISLVDDALSSMNKAKNILIKTKGGEQ